MKRGLLRLNWIILLLGMFAGSFYAATQAQAPPQLKNLLVEVWPEYDRPEVLVIYRGELQPDTQLPALLTFRLPGYLEDMHAIAVEQDGSLVDANPDSVELRHEGDDLLLTFATPSRRIQFEYYDPVILTKDGQSRQLDFEFSAPYLIEKTAFELQEPYQAQDFVVTPPPDNSFAGADGLRYNNIEVAGLAAGDNFSLSAIYQRETDDVSVNNITRNPEGLTGAPTNQPVDLDDTGPTLLNSQDFTLGYVLIGAGAILLAGTGAYWWWSTRRETPPERYAASSASRRRPARRKKQTMASRGKPDQTAPAAAQPAAGFCYRCGTALRPNGNFCHACGAERRAD